MALTWLAKTPLRPTTLDSRSAQEVLISAQQRVQWLQTAADPGPGPAAHRSTPEERLATATTRPHTSCRPPAEKVLTPGVVEHLDIACARRAAQLQTLPTGLPRTGRYNNSSVGELAGGAGFSGPARL